MRLLFFILVVLLTGCNISKYSTNCDFTPATHSYSYNEISDSTIMNKRTQIILNTDSTLYGRISGITSDNLIIISNLTNEKVSVPFSNINSFQVSGFPIPFYERASFGFGIGATFLMLIIPATVKENNSPNPSDANINLTLGFLGISLAGGYYLATHSAYNEDELKGALVTVHVK